MPSGRRRIAFVLTLITKHGIETEKTNCVMNATNVSTSNTRTHLWDFQTAKPLSAKRAPRAGLCIVWVCKD
jgi:hypothetical protein